MFMLVVICAVFGLVVAHSPVPHSVGRSEDVHSQSDDFRADGFGSSLHIYNGIERTAKADVDGIFKGSIKWVTPEGDHVKVTYGANENGWQASMPAMTPTLPPIPEAFHSPVSEPPHHNQDSSP
ncbi:larval cuticle protein 1 [Drosophila sechellia]|uniref:GM20689 n=1 Tax=Drosophila sechellia TaxID=7238 RepID=B4HRW8_DROSE|nr:larval cuticle protein 1 [Drosophila sechellia]EDW46931.1 GM20689 [Drosophila sechellia]